MSNLDHLAGEPLDGRDLQILDSVRDLWTAVDPVPDGLSERIRFAMSVASLEAEVARIVDDSEALAGVRSVYERATSLTFETNSVSAMLDIDEVDPDHVDITGWVSELDTEVELRERSRSRITHTDGNGRFEFIGIEHGLVQLVFRPGEAGTPTIITPAIEL